MNHAEPGLFDLPEPERQPPPSRTQTGRNRQMWTCTVTAEVSIVDAAAVKGATGHYLANTVVIDAGTRAVIEDPGLHDAGSDPAHPPFDQLPWLINPITGLQTLMEEGAFRIVDVDIAVTPESADRGTATWTITVKLTDVHALRRLATQAHPDDAELIADSLALAWQRAADPFAPLHSIPGITWRPVSVNIEHVPARIARAR